MTEPRVIPRLSAGKSFKWLGYYLTHDPQAQSAERVAWTHTLNLANDNVPEAISEMLWTFRGADWLKRQAGVPTGGRRLENPVKHFSLNWHRSEQPDREHMVETVQTFLDHMGWGEHQAVIVCHVDRHPHVHVMLNAVHPETGRALDTGFEKRRASEWALAYEREHSQIFCEQRLLPEDQREPAPTREAWMKMKETEQRHDKVEAGRAAEGLDYFERVGQSRWQAKEWELLRGYQKDQRIEFFAEGKELFRERRSEVFREVRMEFREDWKTYYQAKRDGVRADRLADMKEDILARQNTELERRRDEACGSLLEHRENEYEYLKLKQKEERAELAVRQQQGLRSFQLLDRIYDPDGPFLAGRAEYYEKMFAEEDRHATEPFNAAARETCEPAPEISPETRDRGEPDLFETPANEKVKVRDGLDVVGGLGLGALGAIATIGERLFDGFLGGGEQARPRQAPSADQPKPGVQERKARAAEAQVKAAESQATEAEQLQAYWQERGRRRGRDRD
jgi:hypothetical protein